jgi:RNA polymerase sigma-70 factor (TIGR02943 family)
MFVECMEPASAQPMQPATAAALSASDATRAKAEQWLAEHGDVLWKFCLARTRSQQVAEDIVQETLLAAMKGVMTFGGESSERTWLLGIAANKIADHFRRRSREANHLGRTAQAHDAACTCDACGRAWTSDGRWAQVPAAWKMETESDVAVLRDHLRGCLEELPPAQAKLVWLRELQAVPSEHICKALDISATNMWTRLHRARLALRACLDRKLRDTGSREEQQP